jgi:hypothetical protein
MKLGQRVAAIRSTGKYVDDNIQRRKSLDDLGFQWRLRLPSPDTGTADTTTFDQIFSALVTYKNEILDKQEQLPFNPLDEEDSERIDSDEDAFSSSFHIPKNFVVPSYAPWPEETRGLPLGKMLSNIRSKAFLKANPDAMDKLQSIGFELDGKAAANDAKFALVYRALAAYKQLYGNLLVPQPFVIPSQNEDWPQETWGLRLGARVNAIRSQGTFVKTNPERTKILTDLGFEWETSNWSKSAATTKKGRKRKEQEETNIETYFNDAEGIRDEDSPSSPFLQNPGSTMGNTMPSNLPKDLSKSPKDDDDDMDEEYEDEIMEEDEMEFGSPSTGGGSRDSKSAMDMDRVTSIMKESPMEPPPRIEEEYQAPKDLNTTLMAAAEMAKAVGVIESIG